MINKRVILQEKGITLIALVVTIIVLLILASVTISLALNNNGLIERAGETSNVWKNAINDEELMFQQADREIGEQSGNSEPQVTKTVIKAGDTTISGDSISGNETLKSMYGENTDYTSVDGVTWQLFYDDEDNIYLIASEWVPGNTLPSELLVSSPFRN